MNAQLLPIALLDPNAGQIDGLPKNPRFIRDVRFEKLVKSIADDPEMMDLRECLVYPVDGRYVVIGGNMRLRACKELKYKEIPCKVLDAATPVEKLRAYTIKDNIGFGDDDTDLLANEWDQGELIDWGVEVAEWNTVVEEPAAEEDNYTGEPPAEPVTVLGDLYELNGHRVLCGDSTDSDAVARLMDGKKADFCFTSPPYNSGIGKGNKTDRLGGNGFYNDEKTDKKTADEYIQFNEDILATLLTVASSDIILCYNINYNKNSPSEYVDVVSQFKESIPLVETVVWEKTMAISLVGNNFTRIFEFVFIFAMNGIKMNKEHNECERNLWKINNVGANSETHKACFPVEFVSKGISLLCKPSGNIYEPFTGSGTTMIASEQLGRTCYGMELDPSYTDLSVRRWVAFMATNGKPYTVKRNGVDITKEAWLTE